MDHPEKFDVIIVGAGPAGLVAEVFMNKLVEPDPPKKIRPLKTIIIEKEGVTAPLWRNHTYDDLTLQCSKEKCKLPHQDFPETCDRYPTKDDLIKYLDEYEKKLKSELHFNEEVTEAEYERGATRWKITTQKRTPGEAPETKTYFSSLLVVASGLNEVPKIPYFPGLDEHFPVSPENPDSPPAKQIHVRGYKNGKKYKDMHVLVVGCGDSAIDICGGLINAGAIPYIVVKESERTQKFYEKARKKGVGRIKLPFKTSLSQLSKTVGNRGNCKLGNIDKKCNLTAYVFCSDIDRFEKNSVYFSSDPNTRQYIDCVILATGYVHNTDKWLKSAKITIEDMGHKQFADSKIGKINDATSCDNRIAIIGFDSEKGLSSLTKLRR